METISETYHFIRNKACIVCGAGFKTPRAGKLYCSKKCKQFSFYHKEEIIKLKTATKGINDSSSTLYLKEYEMYDSTVTNQKELSNLIRRKDSTWGTFTELNEQRLQKLEKILPEYIKKLKLHRLSIEEWSFLKILFRHLKKDNFIKLIDSLDERFISNLKHIDANKKSEKISPITLLYNNHLLKIAEGKIKFV